VPNTFLVFAFCLEPEPPDTGAALPSLAEQTVDTFPPFSIWSTTITITRPRQSAKNAEIPKKKNTEKSSLEASFHPERSVLFVCHLPHRTI
jgi:hypothetical protein